MSGSLFVKDTFSPVAARARRLSGEARVSVDSVALALHSYDAGLARFRPEAVISVAEASGLAPLMRLLAENGVPVTPRGLGSSLTGGCAPAKGGAVLKLGGLNKILEIDTAAGYAFVEAGVCNGVLQDELSRAGFFYSPLPLSFRCSTVGGNIAVNARGPRSLKYGSSADNLLAVDVVSPGGDEFRLERGCGGPDMAGFFSGLEGTCGVAARVKVRITRRSGTLIYFLAAFNSPEELLLAAAQAQSQGVCFRSLEALDKMSATASESCFGDGYPLDCGALAVGELDGHGAADDLKTLKRVFKAAGCPWFKADECDPKSEPVWLASSRAFSAVARLSHSVLSEDFSVPRKKLGLAIGAASAALAQYDLRAGMVYSPCTGSLRPSILFDERNIFETRRARKAAHEMLKACAEMG
ncbi:MAG: FAD-binding protein, partial [Elusimicrobia bacterium]|nr:FAD-binding protein [Elusimicrobiota bacterium]